jgi:hypothetical protein
LELINGPVARDRCRPFLFERRLLGEPFEEFDDAHVCGFAVSGDVGAAGDLGAICGVVLVSAEEHLFVGEGGGPAEALLDAGGVEEEALGDHLVVVGAKWGDAQLVGELHGGDSGALRE